MGLRVSDKENMHCTCTVIILFDFDFLKRGLDASIVYYILRHMIECEK